MGNRKRRPQNNSLRNRRASFDYALEDSLVAGLELTGAETKSLRHGHGHLKGAYVTTRDNELYLINATITGSNAVPIAEDDVTRARKLLVKRKDIDALLAAKKQGRSIVPLEILNRGRFVKLRIALGKGKKTTDKRQTIKKREDKIASERAIKHHSR